MSYSLSAALQTAVFDRLASDAALTALVGTNIFDAPPDGTPPALYVSLGPEDVRERSDKTGRGAFHDFTVSVVTDVSGFLGAKQAAGAACDALDGAPLTLSSGRLVGLWFRQAKARRERSTGERRIDMQFRARVEQ